MARPPPVAETSLPRRRGTAPGHPAVTAAGPPAKGNRCTASCSRSPSRPLRSRRPTAGGLPPLPEPVTSFGAAPADGFVYVYGGHTGPAHTYSVEDQSGAFRRLDLSALSRWEDLPSGPKLQGLALVAHGGKVYRLGGFSALNAEGEEHDLRSQSAVAEYDPESRTWTDLTPLPGPRSSFDAAVLGDRVYVVGGWNLRGDSGGDWHATAWSADLSKRPLVWKRVPDPPSRRRALAVAAHDGKLFAIGGMTEDGPTRSVEVFDPQSGTWSPGPDLLGEKPIDGFGAEACEAAGRLYVSSLAGTVQRLSDDGTRWEVAAPLDPPRFFHGMVPRDGGLLVVGGANMTDGKITETEAVPLAPQGE